MWVHDGTHEGGSGKRKFAQELTRRDRKTVSHPAPLGDRTLWVFGFEF